MIKKWLLNNKDVTEDTTFVISKSVGGIGYAWKIVKAEFPNDTIGRYTKGYAYDGHGSMLFHDINYYFQIIRRSWRTNE